MKLLKNKVNSSADASYPLGKIRDDNGDGISGSQVDAEFMNDYVQFMEKMFADSGLTANDDPDNETNGYQLFEAFKVSLRKNKGFLTSCFRLTGTSTELVITDTIIDEIGGTISLSRSTTGEYIFSLTKTGLSSSSKVYIDFSSGARDLAGSPLRDANIESFGASTNLLNAIIINRQISGASIGSLIDDFEGVLRITIYD